VPIRRGGGGGCMDFGIGSYWINATLPQALTGCCWTSGRTGIAWGPTRRHDIHTTKLVGGVVVRLAAHA
jgi:hypothetical protein